jgi:uncharacterized membrane protein YebE (DUF533 family)
MWHRLPADLARIWHMSVETWVAAVVVVSKRNTMMANAMLFPASFDAQEFGRMVPEKVDVFLRGMAATARADGPIDATIAALTPVHARVTANARRLRRR